jgi:hypothetical protein
MSFTLRRKPESQSHKYYCCKFETAFLSMTKSRAGSTSNHVTDSACGVEESVWLVVSVDNRKIVFRFFTSVSLSDEHRNPLSITFSLNRSFLPGDSVAETRSSPPFSGDIKNEWSYRLPTLPLLLNGVSGIALTLKPFRYVRERRFHSQRNCVNLLAPEFGI